MTLVLALTTLTTGSAAAHSPDAVTLADHRSTEVSTALAPLRHAVVERRADTWHHQDRLGEPRTPTAYRERTTHSPRYLRWQKRLWAKRAHRAYRKVLSGLWLRDFRAAPGQNAWQRAVSEVQRPYPGTEGWLLSCSASEGGWGRWVPNSQGSGVGGWLQFMPGTWSGFYRHASSDVTSRGYKVPSSAASWYSPLGQALAGAWGVTHGMRHHWVGSGC